MSPVVVSPPEGKVTRPPETTGTTVAKVLLVLVGVALIGLSVFGVVAGRIWGNETTEVSTPSETTPSETTPSETTPSSTGPSGASEATAAPGPSGATTTTKKTTTKNFGSDELLIAGFATGAALIAFGLLFPRISVLKLPGGIELSTAANKEESEKVENEVQKKVEAGEVEPSKAPAVTVAALDNVRTEKLARLRTSSDWGNPVWDSESGSVGWGKTLTDEKIAESVAAAAAEHGSSDT